MSEHNKASLHSFSRHFTRLHVLSILSSYVMTCSVSSRVLPSALELIAQAQLHKNQQLLEQYNT